jgi:hypothetical protein
MQYRKHKWNLNAGYVYANIHGNYPLSYEKFIEDKIHLKTNSVSSKNPNEHYSYLAHYGRFGLDFNPNDKHVFSFNTSFAYSDINDRTNYELLKTDLTINSKNIMSELINSDNKEKDFRSSLFYQGKLSEKWRLDASINYNLLQRNYGNSYQFSNTFFSQSKYESRKDYIHGTISNVYNPNEKISVDWGTSFIYNNYKIRDKIYLKEYSTIQSTRSNTYGYFTFLWNEQLATRFGLTGIHVNQEGESRFLLQPEFILNYNPDQTIGFRLNYKSAANYPKQYHLTPDSYYIDSLMIQTGNPDLIPLSYSHTIMLTTTFWDNLSLNVLLDYSPDYISAFYKQTENKEIISTFSNSKFQQMGFSVNYDWKLNENFSWSNSVLLNYSEIKKNTLYHAIYSWQIHSNLRYFHQPWGLLGELTYSHDKIRSPLLQGFKETGQDLWEVSLNKQFLAGKWNVSLIYILPIQWGIRDSQINAIKTPFYQSENFLNLKTYNNMLFLRLTYRFNQGNKTKSIIDKTLYDDENKEDRGLKF